MSPDGKLTDVECLALWDAINEYVRACGGDPGARPSVARMNAVAAVTRSVVAIVNDTVEARRQ